MSFLQKLDNLPVFHHVVKALRLRDAAGGLLRRFPRVRRLPKSGAVYRCRYLETLLLADELFQRNVYLKAIDPARVQTFADLGSNVGLFAVLLVEMTGRRDLRGLMIDANPEMIAETTWHLDQNRLPGVKPVHGLAGSASTGDSVDFFLLPSNLGSSQFAVYEPGKPPKGEWKKISVPRVDLETAWLRDVGDVRCHFCKIDIEGSEKQLLQTDQRFLARVDTIILEWHKWIAQREELDRMLADQGFRLVEVLEDLGQTGIAWYAR